jgi:hypothetical protein
MADGLILLAFIAIVIAVVTARVRRRLGFPVQRGFYATAVGMIAITVLIFWAVQGR